MIKRVALIAFLTGSGQLVSVFSIKFSYQWLTTAQSASFAQIDSLYFLLMNLIALGLQSAAIRNIAVLKHWKPEYDQIQSARVLFSLILACAGLFSVFKWEYIIFFVAPVLALSGDYALYAIGRPVTGALISFFRSMVPYSFLFITAWLKPAWANYAFISGWITVFLITDLVIASILKVRILPRLRLVDLKRYVESLPLGFISLSYYILGIGILLMVPYFYPPAAGSLAFIGLKFYVLYKGVLRIIHQAFIKEMIQPEWCLRVDQLSILVSLLFAASILFYPASFITLFFGKQYISEQPFFLTLSAGAVLYSLCQSASTKSLLDKKDLPYTIVACAASLAAIICTVVFSYFYPSAFSIGLSICAGECILLFGLVRISSLPRLLPTRIIFLLINSLLLIIPFLAGYFLQDELPWYVCGMGVFSAVLFLFNRKKLAIW